MSSPAEAVETPMNVVTVEEEVDGGSGGLEVEDTQHQLKQSGDDKETTTKQASSSASSAAMKSAPGSCTINSPSPPSFQTSGWFCQLSCVLRKNTLLLWRRPLTLLCMLTSSIGSVLLAWARGKNAELFDATQLTQCGTINNFYADDNYEADLTLNENWRNGLAVTLMAFGPMLLAILTFLMVHVELEMKMLGTLRALGLRESVYWTSWHIPFTLISLINALLGAITAQLLHSQVHVYQNVYFGGVFASLFFLNVALVSASMFLAALCSTSRHASPWIILLMLIGAWIPFIVIAVSSYTPYSASSVNYGISTTPTGLFWINGNTTRGYQDYVDNGGGTWTDEWTQCDNPIMSQKEGSNWKTEEERDDVLPSEYFMGCYFAAGYTSFIWNKPGSQFGVAVMFLFPYTHFLTIWGNMLGYTAMPNRRFEMQHASWSPEDLAIHSLPSSPSNYPQNTKGTTLFPQGSTLNLNYQYLPYDQSYYSDENGNRVSYNNCPAQTSSEFFCPYLNQCGSGSPSNDSPSVYHMLGFLSSLAFFYTFLAVYWSLVFPGGNGAPQKFYFFLLPTYWFGAKATKPDAIRSAASNSSAAHESTTVGVVVNGIRKKYGDCEAIKGVSLALECGEMTAILGHNGAGKTTLSHVLSCEIAPSAGDVRVFGHSVTQDPYSVRQLVGLCKQDDFLYPNLSAKEHLELFAGLRGVASSAIAETVDKWLESVDLAIVADHFTTSFSGGMKRRLSVALSTIGGRPVIILDEPTTGMDPVSRRFVWKHIDEIKEGRVVLLTTHAMEEADLLSDMVAIMRKGELAALGTPLELKSQYGSAIQFSVLVDQENTVATKEAILDRFAVDKEWIAVDAGDSGNITVNITKIRQGENTEGVDVEILAKFVAWLESRESGVSEYGFSNSSLEEVFLKVTKGDKDEVKEHDEVDDTNVCCSCWSRGCLQCCLRGPCRCCCCPSPRHHDHETGVDEELQELNAAADVGDNLKELSSFKPVLTVGRQTLALTVFSFLRGWTGKRSTGNWIIYTMLLSGVVIIGLSAGGFYDTTPALTLPTVVLSLILVTLVSPIYVDRKYGLDYLMRSQGLLKMSYLFGHGLYALSLALIFGIVVLSLFYATPLFREPIICEPCDDYYNCNCPSQHTFGDRRIVGQSSLTSIDWFSDTYNGEPVSLYATFTAGSYGKIMGAAIMFALTMPGALFASSYLPGHKLALVCICVVTLVAGVVPLILYFTYTYSQDPADMLQCAWNVCNTTRTSFNISTIGSSTTEFLNCVGLETNMNSLGGMCLPPVAAVLPEIGLFQMLSMTLLSQVIFVSDPADYVEQVLVPAMPNAKCSGKNCQFPFAHALYGKYIGFMFLGALLLLLIGYAQVSVISFPNKWVLTVKHSITRLVCWWRSKKAGQEKEHSGDTSTLINGEGDVLEEVKEESDYVASILQPLLKPHDPSTVEEGGDENGDVVLTDHERIPRDVLPPVVSYKLGKIYPSIGGLPPKVALQSLDLHVPKGQVLGLLGKNGAGKTTALKILSVAHDASSGLGLVAGYDVSCEQLKVFERLGACPQFDTALWPSLTVKMHLEFFARLKGLPLNEVKAIAHSIADAVGLGSPSVFHRHAGGLSGGMRRRLSIGISLIGAPSVLLLDEPSTGLDPSTRNSIWSLVNSFSTDERAIIITTHMMIEADTLCSRIAIMSHGRLKVVATQQRLKDRFGSGYLLQLNLLKSTPECQEIAMDFVRTRLHKEAILQTKQAKTLHVALPRDLNLTEVFRVLYSDESATVGGINQFLLSQSSLEDVFLALGD